ncbi:MAG: TonB-dependent receptor [Crocinitomicaceae bacterium]|nr:TonB-dependent receptor [Flavobacteriales bacterium]NQZ36271.1 TonB-dependent receptor [Crocinitomicaceae bacterium]
MKLLLSLSFLTLIFFVQGQVEGIVVDSEQIGIPGVKLKNQQSGKLARTSEDGSFVIAAKENDTLIVSMMEFDTVRYIVKPNDLNQRFTIVLTEGYQDVQGANVIRKYMEGFDVGFLPPIRGVQIYTGTNAVIELAELSGAKSAANPREIFAKVPGLNIWESDGAGIQVGIGGRGLSPNRTANFNTRQNGYDISADALGYPESYYTPPFEALKAIEIIRGSASLQFGSQFGGLLNFIIKDAPNNTPFEFTSRTTGGMYGYLGTFNRIAGSKHRVFYQAYHQYKRGNGYRDNSNFAQHQAFAQFGYYLTENIKVRLEYTHMNYLAKQAGGLSDLQFDENPRQSLRDRNWFKVNWNMLAFHYDHEISKKAHFNVRAFGMASSRQTLGFLGKITQQDPGGTRDMLAGKFRNAGAEARFLQRYDIKRAKNKTRVRGAFLVGARYYRGTTTADQGKATDGSDANFVYQNPEDLEGSAFTYPSENSAGFAENILFLGNRVTVNFGLRMESIQSGSSGYYKQYSIHPVNLDTLAVYTIQDNNSLKRFVPLFGAGTSYRTSKRSKAYVNFTQNYRAINFTDIRISNPNIVIDSAIRDEYGYTMELGFRGIQKDFWIYDVAAFYVFYGDKIGLAPKSGTTYKERTNIGNARNMGLEVFTEFDFIKAFKDSSKHSFSLFVNAAYIDARYITSKEPNFVGKKVEYVSPFILKSGIKYKYKGWNFQIQGSYNAEQFSDASNSVLPSGDAVIGLIPSYLVFDFSARYAFSKYVQLEAGVNNLTNERYYTRRAVAYPGPGILPSDGVSAYLTIQFKFAK